MSAHATLDTVCPNNHNLTLTFTEDEWERKLKADELVLHCNTCDANWTPTKAEIAGMRKQFAEARARA